MTDVELIWESYNNAIDKVSVLWVFYLPKKEILDIERCGVSYDMFENINKDAKITYDDYHNILNIINSNLTTIKQKLSTYHDKVRDDVFGKHIINNIKKYVTFEDMIDNINSIESLIKIRDQFDRDVNCYKNS